jgi:hypothetical protein
MGLTESEKTACKDLLNNIKTDYLGNKLTANELGLTGRDLNVPSSKLKDAANYMKTLPDTYKLVKGTKTTDHVIMYIVSPKKQAKLDITGHEIKVKNGQEIDVTMQGGGQAGVALFNVHVNFTGVSENIKKQQQAHMAKVEENKKTFKAKQEAEKKAALLKSQPFLALAGLGGDDGSDSDSES